VGDPGGEAHRQSPARRGERARGPQRRVNVRLRPREEQPGCRTVQVSAKTVGAPEFDLRKRYPAGQRTAARAQGHGWKQGRAPRPAEKTRGSKVTARAERRSAAKGESPTDGSVVATTRGNARRAKGPCRRHSEQEVRQERDDKAHHQSAGSSSKDRPTGEVGACAPLLGTARPSREARDARSERIWRQSATAEPPERTRRRSRRSRRAAETNSFGSSPRSCTQGRTAPGRIDEERFRRRAARSA
jgi:hypothetical protein